MHSTKCETGCILLMSIARRSYPVLAQSQKEVGAVRGMIIAGRDVGYDPDHLRKLKGADFGRVKFMTYDDLSAAFDALLRALDST